jgi:glycosyltransferase involved in cell wall biosynthesis
MAQAIRAAGGRALVASSGGRLESKLRSVGGELIKIPLDAKGPLALWRNSRRLRKIIRKENVDLVHARSRGPAWSGYWATRRGSATPFLTTYHGAYNEGSRAKRRYNSVMARGKPVIAVSQFIAEMVAERHGVDPSGIVTIPRGADLSVFDRDKVHTERIGELVTSWNLADEVRPIFMLPGRLTRWKGQEVFVDACKIVRERRGPDAFLGLIVGDAKPGSDYVRSLDRRIAASGSGDSIRIVGSCNDMAAAYRLASCVVSASTDPEAFGRVAVEAQAMGCPVIATNHGGGRETVEDDVTGILVEPGNAEAMANAMEEILDLSEEERSWVFDAATARVAEHFSTERMQQATLDVYESVLGSSFARR